MTLDQIIMSRRSIRKYQNKPIDRESLLQVLEAGRFAPSARNNQNWHFTCVENAALREELAEACCGQQMIAEAPAALIVWADEDRKMACKQSAASVDCSIALSFMMLKAAELGLGTCWLGSFYEDQVRRVLTLPDTAVVVAVTPLGWPDEAPPARPRLPIEEVIDIRE